ncbi:hypothetical protein [Pseudomonas sp. GOM6]|uniref:hypothetical protein n=1 Tax=Pseudomonas sp. GOM6 TaxID=3036944 RepID=UPI002409B7EA|nr:hypothetical protein [Pseudomonas sp. GOM6]MDG1581068.1 hypothetical protein [Pseudomonas sp. GOM6]
MATYAQRFVNEARDLMPYQSDLQTLALEIDNPTEISEVMVPKGEYVAGMTTVILALLAREDARVY